jgi:hypothetical protein
MEEALEALQSEREQKYAVKKELDKRINSESILNLSSFAGFAGLKFGSKKSIITPDKSISISSLPQTSGHNSFIGEPKAQVKAIGFASSSNQISSKEHLKSIDSLIVRKNVRNHSVIEKVNLDQCKNEGSNSTLSNETKVDQNWNFLNSKKLLSQTLEIDKDSDRIILIESCDNGCHAFWRTLWSLIISCFAACIAP